MSDQARESLLVGLVGEGITASLTPALQEREGAASGLRLTYRLLDAALHEYGVPDLPALLRWARTFGFGGLNVTHPFKQAIVPLLDELSSDARALGAVNTVVLREGRTIGHNTDFSGYAWALRNTLPDAVGDPVALIGAGGAGVAVGYALLSLGAARVEIVDTNAEQAAAAVRRLERRFGDRVRVADSLEAALSGAHGLVNATPVGMIGHPGLPVPEELITEHLWVSDIVYFPLETDLIRLARERGCQVVPGGGMAIGQAIDAFEHFTGRPADPQRMTAAFAELSAARLAALGV